MLRPEMASDSQGCGGGSIGSSGRILLLLLVVERKMKVMSVYV